MQGGSHAITELPDRRTMLLPTLLVLLLLLLFAAGATPI